MCIGMFRTLSLGEVCAYYMIVLRPYRYGNVTCSPQRAMIGRGITRSVVANTGLHIHPTRYGIQILFLVSLGACHCGGCQAKHVALGFSGMLGYIVSIRSGRIVHLLVQYKDMLDSAHSYFKLCHHKIFGFGTLYFGMLDSHNDINMLQRPRVFTRLVKDNSAVVNYKINDH
jgi:hypothetical protein